MYACVHTCKYAFMYACVHADKRICRVINIVSPAQTERGGSVMQRAAANQVQLVDLSSSPHQRDDALAVPVGSSVVQRRPARRHMGSL